MEDGRIEGAFLYEHTFLTIVSLSWGAQKVPKGDPFGTRPVWDPHWKPHWGRLTAPHWGSQRGPNWGSQTGSKAYWEAPKDPKPQNHPKTPTRRFLAAFWGGLGGVWGVVLGFPSRNAQRPPQTPQTPPKRCVLVRFGGLGDPRPVYRTQTPDAYGRLVSGGPFMGPVLAETHLNPTSGHDPNPKRWPF